MTWEDERKVHQHDAFLTLYQFPHIQQFFIRVLVARAVKTIVVGKAYVIMRWVNVAAFMDSAVSILFNFGSSLLLFLLQQLLS